MTEYLKGLSDRFQVVVLTVKTPDHTHIERYHGARLLRVPVGSGDLAARVQAFDRAVRRQLDSEEYVMVHSFDPFGGYALCERRAEFSYKIIYDASALPSVDLPHLHDEVEANRRFIARVRRQELFCLMNADAVIVANELTREFVTGLGVAREQVSVLPCPVDLTPYKPEVMGVPDATPMKLVHVGNLSNANDLPLVLEAMQLALQSGVDLGLTVVGPRHPAHQARLEERIAALKLAGKIEFQDPVAHDDLHKVLATADVGLVSLSETERNVQVGSPLSRAAEYLAAGRPVIAADVPVARATLQEEGVVFYRPGDKQSLADAIVALASEPARRVKLGKEARAQALEHDGAKIRADLVAKYVALTGTGVRAIGDAETTTPDEVTQLGQSILQEDTKERKRRAALEKKTTSGEQKVTTDPAIGSADTSPEAALGERPAVMGVPIREEEPPIVLGEEARELANELVQQVTTEPNAHRQTEPPVVMGMPIPGAQGVLPAAGAVITPGDLASELGQVDEPKPPMSSSPTVIESAGRPAGGIETASTTDPTAAPLADELPDTGAHLSLVPKEPPPPVARGKGASTVGPVPSAPGKKRGTRASKASHDASGEKKDATRTSKSSLEPVAEKEKKETRSSLEPVVEKPWDKDASAEKIAADLAKRSEPRPDADALADKIAAELAKRPETGSKRKAEESSSTKALLTPAERAAAEKLTQQILAAAKAKAEAKEAKPEVKPEHTEKAFSDKTPAPARALPSDEPLINPFAAEKTPTPVSDEPLVPSPFTSSSPSFSSRDTQPPSFSSLTPTAPPAAPAAPSELEVESIPPRPRASVPPPPLTPASDRVFIPPLEMPGVTPSPKSSVSGLTPALAPKSSTSGLNPTLRSSPSSTGLPIVPAVARPPEFVPLLTPPQGASTSPSGVTRPPPLPPRTTSGTFATLAATPGAPAKPLGALGGEPPPLPFASSMTPPPLAKPSGLFPEAPAVPAKTPIAKAKLEPGPQVPGPDVIGDSEIEEVDDGPQEIGDDELMEVPSAIHAAVTEPRGTPVAKPASATLASTTSDDAVEMAPEDAGVQTVDTDASPPPSAIDPWLAMLVHGYCPPASGLFNRHTPPTTMPGRDT